MYQAKNNTSYTFHWMLNKKHALYATNQTLSKVKLIHSKHLAKLCMNEKGQDVRIKFNQEEKNILHSKTKHHLGFLIGSQIIVFKFNLQKL